MAQRHVTLDLREIGPYLSTYKSSLVAGALLIPVSALDSELAPEFRAEILLPFGIRAGPMRCQIIQRLPDGSIAAQIPDMPKPVRAQLLAVVEGVEQVKAYLLAQGELVVPDAKATPPQSPDVAQDQVADGGPASVQAPEPEGAEPEAAASQEPKESPAPTLEPQPAPSERSSPHGYALPEGLDTAAVSAQGSLEGKSLRNFMMDAAMGQLTGILKIETAVCVRHAFFLDGGPVGWRRSPIEAQETLGGLLFKSERLNQQDLDQALEQVRDGGQRLGQVLIERGLLAQAQLGAVLRKQVEYVLQLSLRDKQGSWSFQPNELGQSFAIAPVSILSVLYPVLAGHAKSIDPARIFGVLRSKLNMRTNLAAAAQPLLASVDWSEGEAALVKVLEGPPAKVRNFFHQVDLPRSEVAACLWALAELGVITFGKGNMSGEERKRYLRQITGPIQARLAKLQQCNPFDALDLNWICTQEQVQAAYGSWRARFETGRFTELPKELLAELEQVQGLHQRAYDRIKTRALRERSRLEFLDEGAVQQAHQELLSRGDPKAQALAADLVP